MSMNRASRLLAAEVRTLLALHPSDPELLASVAALRRRAFTPPPPTELPSGSPVEVARAFSARTDDDLAALASSIVAAPDPASDPDRAAAALELFLRVPGEAARARALCDRLETQGHDVRLARFRLAADQLVTRHAGAPEALVAALDTVLTTLAETHGALGKAPLDQARQRAAALALTALADAQRLPHGAQWLVVTQDRAAVLDAELALSRRPALASELGPIARWLATPPSTPVDERDLATSRSVREAFELTAASLALPPLPALELPRSGFAPRAVRLAEAAHLAPRAPLVGQDLGDAAALLVLGDRRAAAATTLALALAAPSAASLEAAAHAVRLADALTSSERSSLAEHLADPRMDDELALRDPSLRTAAALLYRLRPDPLLKLRLAAASADGSPPGARATASVDEAPASDPHHPDNRLAAASDLLATGQDSAAANILAALLRKVEAEAASDDTPPRLYAVVTTALEVEAPPEELIRAARRALHDERRAPPLISALRASPTAGFALHEDLLELARDPSRKDLDRLSALEAWLAIWRATETAPDPDALQSLRRDEPALPAAAATRLGLYAKPFTVLGTFLATDASAGPGTGHAYAEALLALSLGRA